MSEINNESTGTSTPTPEKQAPVQASEEGDQAGAQTSPGYMLASARKAQNVSIEELSAQTMLGRDTVQALEDNNFGRMSQPVFVRGYYRKCAKVLGLSEAAIMDAYVAWTGVGGSKPVSANRVRVVPQDVTPGNRSPLRLLLLVLVAVVVLIVAWQLLSSKRGSSDVTPATSTATDNTGVAPQPIEQTSSAQQNVPTPQGSAASRPEPAADQQPEMAADAGADASSDLTAQNSQNATAAPAAAPADSVASPPPDGKLRLRFIQRSWIDVRDANNKRMLAGIVPADTERVIDKGTPPYKIALGYAPGVEVYVGDKRIDLTDKTKSDNTARFTVESGQ